MEETTRNLVGHGYASVRAELMRVFLFLGAVWGCFLLDSLGLPLDRLALVPRTLSGLPGVVAMPFLHYDLQHILANSFPLFVLMMLLAGSRTRSWQIVLSIVVGSGLLLWVAGWSGKYVGASALVFGLIGFLVTAGFLEKRPVSLAIAVVVGLMYGGTFVVGILPLSSRVSELSHFYGAVTGVVVAFILTSGRPTSSATDALPR